MVKEDMLEFSGTVKEILPNAIVMFTDECHAMRMGMKKLPATPLREYKADDPAVATKVGASFN